MTTRPSPRSHAWGIRGFAATAVLLAAVSAIGPAAGLGLGLFFALLGAAPTPQQTHRWAQRCLQAAVIGLGAGVDLPAVARAGLQGLGVTAASITLVLLAGHLLGRLFRVPAHTGLLISAGTAICGGSAIAALAGALRPKHHETAVALGVVFVLNAVALLLFPRLGHAFHLSETAFGWWAALAIHDTSSVVGAGLAYGPTALTVATTIKLTRALWIVPVVFALSQWERRHAPIAATGSTAPTRTGAPFPWFILGFIALAGATSFWPALRPAGDVLAAGSRRLMVSTLFLIGAGLSPAALRNVGWRPLALGVGLWLPTAALSLLAILHA